jgi:uncharacterized protein (DUF3084 family)
MNIWQEMEQCESWEETVDRLRTELAKMTANAELARLDNELLRRELLEAKQEAARFEDAYIRIYKELQKLKGEQ